MRHRQEQQLLVALVDGEHVAHRVAFPHDVLVREHDALGRAGGARRVDEGEAVVGLDLGPALLELAGVRAEPLLAFDAQLAERHEHAFVAGLGDVGERQLGAALRVGLLQLAGLIEVDDLDDAFELVALGHQLGQLRRILDEHDLGARVVDDVLALVRQVRLVDRDGDAAGHENADVAVEPLGPRVREDARALALGDAERQEAAGDLARRFVPIAPRRGAPGAALFPAQHLLRRGRRDAIVEHHHAVLHAERPIARLRCRRFRRRRHRCLHGLQFLREGGRAFNRMLLCGDDVNEQRPLRIPRAGDFCAGAVRAGAAVRRLGRAAPDVSRQTRRARSGSPAAWSGCFARSARRSSRSGRSCRRGPICSRRTSFARSRRCKTTSGPFAYDDVQRTFVSEIRQAAGGAVRGDLAGADRVGVGGAGAQGAHARTVASSRSRCGVRISTSWSRSI